MKTFLVNYQHGGQRYALEIRAADEADAKSRLGSLVYGRVQGEVSAKLPFPLGPFARLFCSVRNALAR